MDEYLDASGRSPFGEWFSGLDPQAAARIVVFLTRIERGNISNVEPVGEGVSECKLDFGPGYRIYFWQRRPGVGDPALRWDKEAPATRHLHGQGALGRLQGAKERQDLMALTRAFKETVLARVQSDPAFREALLTEGVNALLEGDVETGKAVLRDYIKATVGFEALAERTGTPSKSLMRMFGPKGNPAAKNLFAVIGELQRASGLTLAVRAA